MTDLILQQCLNGLVLACNYTLFALGLSVIWGVLKVLNLAHAEIFTFGALAAVFAGQASGLPLPFVFAAAVLAGGVLALIIDTVAFWPLRRKNLSVEDFELASLITSLGASTILLSLATRVTNNQAVSMPPGVFKVEAWRFGSLVLTNVQVIVSVSALFLTLAIWWVVRHSQFGRALRALAYSPDMSKVVGIRTETVYRVTLFTCGALAAVAGVLLTILMGSVDAHSGANLMLKYPGGQCRGDQRPMQGSAAEIRT